MYLDELCLLDGQKWQEGFIKGLSVSLVVVTILSWSPDDGGSLGKLALMSEDNDYVDNILVSLSCTNFDAINTHTLASDRQKHTNAQTNCLKEQLEPSVQSLFTQTKIHCPIVVAQRTFP